MEHYHWRCERKHIWYENCLAIKHQACGKAGSGLNVGALFSFCLTLGKLPPLSSAVLISPKWKITPPSCVLL